MAVGFGVGVGVAPQPLNSRDVRTRVSARNKINAYCPNFTFFTSFLLIILEPDDLTSIRSDSLSVPPWSYYTIFGGEVVIEGNCAVCASCQPRRC